jgi:hypothetical protein
MATGVRWTIARVGSGVEDGKKHHQEEEDKGAKAARTKKPKPTAGKLDFDGLQDQHRTFAEKTVRSGNLAEPNQLATPKTKTAVPRTQNRGLRVGDKFFSIRTAAVIHGGLNIAATLSGHSVETPPFSVIQIFLTGAQVFRF